MWLQSIAEFLRIPQTMKEEIISVVQLRPGDTVTFESGKHETVLALAYRDGRDGRDPVFICGDTQKTACAVEICFDGGRVDIFHPGSSAVRASRI